MGQKPVTRLLSSSFVWSFTVSIICLVGFIILGVTEQQHEGTSSVAMFLLIIMVVAGLVWYVSLGILAHRLGRSWLVWVGLSFITSPIGPLVIFPLMLGHIRAARQTVSAPSAST